jgi:hypothetical protein
MTTPTNSGDQPINIGWDDLADDAVDRRVQELRAAREVPLVQAVGSPTAQGASGGVGALLRGSVTTLGVAGLVGAIVTWVLLEVVVRPDAENHWYGDSITTANVMASLAFVAGFGSVFAAWDGIQARSSAKTGSAVVKALPVLILGGLVGGFITDKVYTSMMEDIQEEAAERASQAIDFIEGERIFFDYMQSHIHLPRGIAIALIGITAGAALGAASRSSKRAVNAVIGGLAGGFVGGYLFDYIGADSESGVIPRLVATVITGLLIGIAMGLVETARREHWLEIVTGGMAGKQFILYHDETVVGSSADCHVTLIKDPQIAPHQITLRRTAAGLVLGNLNPAQPVTVNGQQIHQHTLTDGDLMQLGATVLRYRQRGDNAPVNGQIYG